MRKFTFEASAFQDFAQWATQDKKLHQRLIGLITATLRDPFSGIGKPEPLKYELKGYWSRRINDAHRLVYKVTDDAIIIVACKNHYE
ncbi:MAG: Txe/YoeB family addiction module toxin [Acidobacteria bacterium]|nr:Txe/YoeB family addiction module toxin [Acidobacteriota bacterium]MBI3426779.1 Txe/YoeB family addiction module toxin [Acidobacteriota bacterium]